MIKPRAFFDELSRRGIGLYCGIPDSLLSGLCACIADCAPAAAHPIAANEGNAVGIAMGYHMATGGIAAVYMQNSGLGNAFNPLVSLADSAVYQVPILLLVGWRGEPGFKDEPQHVTQGRVTLAVLEVLGVPAWVLDPESDVEKVLDEAFASLASRSAPVAIVVRQQTFATYFEVEETRGDCELSRENALGGLLDLLAPDDLLITTTGKTSREVYELRDRRGEPSHDFLTVGGMGHASSIALGVALGRPHRRVVCVDGDGAVFMHMGALATIGACAPSNLVHVVLNNRSHDSVGGQPTVARSVELCEFARAVNYPVVARVSDLSALRLAWTHVIAVPGPAFIELRIHRGARTNLGRPRSSARANKLAFMEHALSRE